MASFFENLVQGFKKTGDPDVTHRALVLGDRDGVTGWRQKTFSESPIEMIIVPQAATHLMKLAGVFVRLDAVGVSDEEDLEVGDEIEDADGNFWEIKTVRDHEYGDVRVCDLTKLPLHEA